MSQLSLPIECRTTYTPETFLLHSGVHAIYSELAAGLRSGRYLPFYLHGAARSGKSHLLVKLSATLHGFQYYPRIFSGAELLSWVSSLTSSSKLTGNQVVLVDDFERCMLSPSGQHNHPGVFVNVIETLRRCAIPLLVASRIEPLALIGEEHVGSRIREMKYLRLGNPGRAELVELVTLMARQRGLRLSERKILFLEKRLPCSTELVEQYLGRVAGLLRVRGGLVDYTLLEDAL